MKNKNITIQEIVDILLGLYWFAHRNVIIVPASRQIIIPSKKIFYINDDEEDDQDQTELNDEIFDVLLIQVVEDDDFQKLYSKIKIDSNKKQAVFNLFKNHKELFSTDLKDLKCIPNTNL